MGNQRERGRCSAFRDAARTAHTCFVSIARAGTGLTGVSCPAARAWFAELPSLAHTRRDGPTLRALHAGHRNAHALVAVAGIACQLGVAKPHLPRVRRYSRRAWARLPYRARCVPCEWRPACVSLFGSDDSAGAGAGDQGYTWHISGGGPAAP